MDTRAYLQWCIKSHEAERERVRKRWEKVGYCLAMVGMAALWIAGWIYG